jgi:hypothetical protein
VSEQQHPVAPQILACTNEIDFKKFLFDASNGGRHEADEYLRVGSSKWVARSFQEGWSHILRDIIAELCRRHMLRYGQFPTTADLNDRLTINKEDHDKFKRLVATS